MKNQREKIFDFNDISSISADRLFNRKNYFLKIFFLILYNIYFSLFNIFLWSLNHDSLDSLRYSVRFTRNDVSKNIILLLINIYTFLFLTTLGGFGIVVANFSTINQLEFHGGFVWITMCEGRARHSSSRSINNLSSTVNFGQREINNTAFYT